MNGQRGLLATSSGLLRQMLPFALPYWPHVALTSICLVASSGIAMVPPIITGRIIDVLTAKHFSVLIALVAAQFVISILQSAVGFVQGKSALRFSQGFSMSLQRALVVRLQRAPISFFVRTPLGEITNRLDGDVQQVTSGLSSLFPSVGAVISLLWMVALMPLVNWRLALVSYIFIPLWFATVAPLADRFAALGRRASEARDDLDTAVTERLSLPGIIRVKSFVQFARDLGAIAQRQERIRSVQIQTVNLGLPVTLIQSAVSTIAPAIVLLYGGWLVTHDLCSIGALVTFIGFLGRMYSPIAAIAGVQMQVVSTCGVLQRVSDMLAVPSESASGADVPDAFEVHFDNVSFNYAGEPVLRNVTFKMGGGERILLSGPSGSGKTTIANLLLRFYDPSSGIIRYGGVDIQDIALDRLRSDIGYVPQEPSLVTGTVRENLQYAGHVSDAETWEALRICAAEQFVSELDGGIDCDLGTVASAISGGQRQRLAIARAILKRPRLLILDEATSALDSATEFDVLRRLSTAMPRTTILLIAHRTSALQNGFRHISLHASFGASAAICESA